MQLSSASRSLLYSTDVGRARCGHPYSEWRGAMRHGIAASSAAAACAVSYYNVGHHGDVEQYRRGTCSVIDLSRRFSYITGGGRAGHHRLQLCRCGNIREWLRLCVCLHFSGLNNLCSRCWFSESGSPAYETLLTGHKHTWRELGLQHVGFFASMFLTAQKPAVHSATLYSYRCTVKYKKSKIYVNLRLSQAHKIVRLFNHIKIMYLSITWVHELFFSFQLQHVARNLVFGVAYEVLLQWHSASVLQSNKNQHT